MSVRVSHYQMRGGGWREDWRRGAGSGGGGRGGGDVEEKPAEEKIQNLKTGRLGKSLRET